MLFNTVLFTGNANRPLAQDIATHLSIGLGKAKVARFSDGEVDVEIEQNVRARALTSETAELRSNGSAYVIGAIMSVCTMDWTPD